LPLSKNCMGWWPGTLLRPLNAIAFNPPQRIFQKRHGGIRTRE